MIRLPLYGSGMGYKHYDDLNTNLRTEFSPLWNFLLWQLIESGNYIHHPLSFINLPVFINHVKIPSTVDALYVYSVILRDRYIAAKRVWDKILTTLKDVIIIMSHYTCNDEHLSRSYTDEELMNMKGVRFL